MSYNNRIKKIFLAYLHVSRTFWHILQYLVRKNKCMCMCMCVNDSKTNRILLTGRRAEEFLMKGRLSCLGDSEQKMAFLREWII